jgi:hypothetical protein
MASQILRPDARESFFKPFIGPKVKKRTPLRQKSEKREVEERIYLEKRRDYLSTHPFCEFEGCRNPSRDLHHKAKRGAHYLDESTFMGLCRYHHNFIHDNPNEARAKGLLA